MKIQGLPILYARTRNIDFCPRLLVQPREFTSQEAEECYQLISQSTRYLELAPPQGRSVVIGTGKFAVIGTTAVFEDLYQLNSRTPKYNRLDHENGRKAYGFIGIAVPVGTLRESFELPQNTLLDLYEQSIAARWDERYGETVWKSTNSEEVTLELPAKNLKEQDKETYNITYSRCKDKLILEDGDEEAVTAWAFLKALSGERISLCTRLFLEKAIVESYFQIVTCENTLRQKVLSNILAEAEAEEYHVQQNMDSKSWSGGDREKKDESSEREKGTRPVIFKRKDDQEKVALKTAKVHNTNVRREQSLDDILGQYSVPELEEEPLKKNYQRGQNSGTRDWSDNGGNHQVDLDGIDMALVLGTVAGGASIVVEWIKESHPIVTVATAFGTIVLAGTEVIRVLGKIKK